jgi:hypothetical protein
MERAIKNQSQLTDLRGCELTSSQEKAFAAYLSFLLKTTDSNDTSEFESVVRKAAKIAV